MNRPEEGFCRLCRRVVIEVGHGRRKGKSGPPGNMNAFKHGLAAIQKRRDESITTEYEEGGQAANSRRLDDWIERRNGHVAQDWAELTRLYSQA